jgi:hypothetical protein
MSRAMDVANWEIFLWALSQLRGSSEFIDIEAVFLQCFVLAPARFGWRTRPELPDYKKCAKALQEAEARRPSLLVKTRDSFGRQLTAEGQRWVEENTQRLSSLLLTGMPVPEPRNRPTSRMLAEIERSRPFSLWKENGITPDEKWRMAEVLRCSPDSSWQTWVDRLESARAVAYAAENNAVLHFLDSVRATRPEWFGGPKNEG